MRESVWLALKEAGIHIPGAYAELMFADGLHEPLIEPEALPKVRRANMPICETGDVCGEEIEERRAVPDRLVMDAGSFDESIPLQRVKQCSSTLIVNEVFARYIREQHLRDVILKPVVMQ